MISDLLRSVFVFLGLSLFSIHLCNSAKAEPVTISILSSIITGKALFNAKAVSVQNNSIEKQKVYKLVYSKLYEEKNIEDLISLSAIDNPCTEIDCMGINSSSAAKLINSALLNKKESLEAAIRQQQAWAAIGSFLIAILSLTLSIVSVLRSGGANRQSS